jgi:ribosomal protein S12 methylthiotransferase
MRRGITGERLRSLIADIRRSVPGIALRTTLIVGYPNEGEKEFEELLAFVRETEFDRLGVFTYSQEEGTTAYDMGDPVPQSVKEERKRLIMEAQQEISLRKNEARVGSRLRVLVDEMDHGSAIARSEFDAPEIDNEVIIQDAADCEVGEFCDVEIVDAESYELFAVRH